MLVTPGTVMCEVVVQIQVRLIHLPSTLAGESKLRGTTIRYSTYSPRSDCSEENTIVSRLERVSVEYSIQFVIEEFLRRCPRCPIIEVDCPNLRTLGVGQKLVFCPENLTDLTILHDSFLLCPFLEIFCMRVGYVDEPSSCMVDGR